MSILRLSLLLIFFLFAQAVQAEEATAVPDQPAGQAQSDATVDTEEEGGDTQTKGYERPVREGPATATDKIVDRFMELNTNPEESAGVDFDEYFTMVMQRATDRFDAMDANHDDEVTADEYRAFWKAQKAQYYRLKR